MSPLLPGANAPGYTMPPLPGLKTPGLILIQVEALCGRDARPVCSFVHFV